jgi:hypothetical protein
MVTSWVPLAYHLRLCKDDNAILALRVKDLAEAQVVAEELRSKYAPELTNTAS